MKPYRNKWETSVDNKKGTPECKTDLRTMNLTPGV